MNPEDFREDCNVPSVERRKNDANSAYFPGFIREERSGDGAPHCKLYK